MIRNVLLVAQAFLRSGCSAIYNLYVSTSHCRSLRFPFFYFSPLPDALRRLPERGGSCWLCSTLGQLLHRLHLSTLCNRCPRQEARGEAFGGICGAGMLPVQWQAEMAWFESLQSHDCTYLEFYFSFFSPPAAKWPARDSCKSRNDLS